MTELCLTRSQLIIVSCIPAVDGNHEQLKIRLYGCKLCAPPRSQKLYRVAVKLELDTKILASHCWWCSGNIGGVVEHVAFAWRSALDCLCANV